MVKGILADINTIGYVRDCVLSGRIPCGAFSLKRHGHFLKMAVPIAIESQCECVRPFAKRTAFAASSHSNRDTGIPRRIG
jgi:hypothetical protein